MGVHVHAGVRRDQERVLAPLSYLTDAEIWKSPKCS